MSDITIQSIPVTASVGQLDVLATGTNHTTPGNNLSLKILDLEYEFVFIDDDEDKTLRTKKKIGPRDKQLILEIYNFKNQLGTGVINPWELGRINQRKIYATFYVWGLQKGQKVITWSILIEKNYE